MHFYTVFYSPVAKSMHFYTVFYSPITGCLCLGCMYNWLPVLGLCYNWLPVLELNVKLVACAWAVL
jgi:hypothetical protein